MSGLLIADFPFRFVGDLPAGGGYSVSALAESGPVFGEVKTASREVTALHCEVKADNLVLSFPSSRFTAVYHRAAGRPHLTLRERSKTDNHQLLADAFQAAVAKTRGPILQRDGHSTNSHLLSVMFAPTERTRVPVGGTPSGSKSFHRGWGRTSLAWPSRS